MSTETLSNAERNARASAMSALKENLRDYGLVIALILIMLFFQYFTGGVLFKPVNLTNIVLQNSYIIIMALGMLLVIVAGHIDLSVGSVSGFVGAIAAVLMVQYHMNPFLAGLICLIAGGVIGASQGYWIAYLKIPSFIVTLAGMLVFKGLALWLLGGMSVGPFPREFQLLSAGFIPDVIGPITIGATKLHSTTLVIGVAIVAAMLYFSLRSRRSRESHGYEAEPFSLFVVKNLIISAVVLFLITMMASYKGLPNVLIVMGLLIAIFVFLTKRMTIGRRIYAMGGNVKAAALSGIKTERLTFIVFILMGVLSALAGLIFAARLNTATPKAGLGFELDVIAAVFIGGASMAGGSGQVAGAVIGAFIMGVMNNGMSIMGVNIDWQQVIKGLVLLGAVVFDVYNKNKS
ncbi:MAG: multiple monosaccharide ABC transporter permease [Mesorhizobium sp.]|jgi:putative multiple sugar transport system permease protein|uniref:Xylose transport system permease protein XylH n=1 Tax=Aquamicrobium soli TaxID=1811518 RepID=A0ABV7K6T4_9HYPH